MRVLICLLLMAVVARASGQNYYLLVGTYTNTGNAPGTKMDSTGSKGIYVYRLAEASEGGGVHAMLLSHTEGVCNPSFLTTDPSGRYAYACTDTRMTGAGSLSAFSFDRAAGNLRLIDKVPSGGDNPVYVSLGRSGRWVVMGNYTGGTLSVFPVLEGGGVGVFAQNIHYVGHSIDKARQDRPHVHSVNFSPDGRYLYVPDLGTDRVRIYRWDAGAKQPLTMTGIISVTPGSGPRHMAFHPNGKFVYLLEEMGGAVVAYRYHPENGRLDSLQRLFTHDAGTKGPYRSADIHVTADGRWLYASNREPESNIAVFCIDRTTGLLTAVGAKTTNGMAAMAGEEMKTTTGSLTAGYYQPTLGKEPRNFVLDPTGRFLLVANQLSNTIVIFRIDGRRGMLQPTGETIPVPSPTCLKIIP
jgi:6-phosphogluconolactonase